jgi:hypothetical protein
LRRRVLADGVEQPVARLAERSGSTVTSDLSTSAAITVKHVLSRDLAVGADLLGHLQRPAGEDRQAPQQHLLLGVSRP